MIRIVVAAAICGCTGIPQTPPGSAASEDASVAPLPTVAAASSEQPAVEDASIHHHHGDDHGGH